MICGLGNKCFPIRKPCGPIFDLKIGFPRQKTTSTISCCLQRMSGDQLLGLTYPFGRRQAL